MTKQNKQHNLPEKLLTETEVSKILNCSLRTVRRRIEAGELAIIRDGRLKRVHQKISISTFATVVSGDFARLSPCRHCLHHAAVAEWRHSELS